jgi:hypothetical protein
MTGQTMTTRTPQRPAPDGALLRLAVDADAWAEGVPPAPRGADVTVSFSDVDTAALHGDALRLLGYRIVRPADAQAAGSPVADFLITEALFDAHPTWARALVDQADRAFNLALGPVMASLTDALRPHLSARTARSTITRRRRALPH